MACRNSFLNLFVLVLGAIDIRCIRCIELDLIYFEFWNFCWKAYGLTKTKLNLIKFFHKKISTLLWSKFFYFSPSIFLTDILFLNKFKVKKHINWNISWLANAWIACFICCDCFRCHGSPKNGCHSIPCKKFHIPLSIYIFLIF